jgi:multicomponent Na+:H+ antiporter subunit E
LIGLFPGLPGYWLWLLREIIISSWDVAKLILQPSLPISPTVVILEAETKTDVGQVIFGNSITLSPGTVTLDLHEGKLLIHCLTSEGAKELQKGEANRRAANLERS